MHMFRRFPLLASILLVGCGPGSDTAPEADAGMSDPELRITRHADGDDLLTAGLGLEGLRAPVPPAFADPQAPTATELRRRAVWSNWRGIADTAPGGGLGEAYGRFGPVPGREFHALLTLPGARHPHRVMLQLPDAFDARARCLLVTAASGSRGVYGAIALAGGWGLPRGCAVVHTDKGGGTGWFDAAGGRGARLDGTPGDRGEGLEFEPAEASADKPRVAVKHFHSGDNPEADWGRHVHQAAVFGLRMLNEHLPAEAPFDWSNTRVIAVGLSNGGGAVLRAAEIDGDWLDGVVAIAPNVLPGASGRPLFDLGTEAALYLPCALTATAFEEDPLARPAGVLPPVWRQQCTALHEAGLLGAGDPAAQADEALERLRAKGWTPQALAAGALSTTFDLWRSVAAAYASAYARTPADAMPCGYAYAMLEGGVPRAPTAAEQAAWWSDVAGVPPGGGVALLDGLAEGEIPALPGLLCLRRLWEGEGRHAAMLQASIEATRTGLPRPGLPVILMHGMDDGLVPEAFTSAPYARWLDEAGRPLTYWRIHHAQHFDAFLGLPPLATRYVPLLPYAWAGLDAMWAHLEHGRPLPASAEIRPQPRAAGETLSREALRLPE